MFFSFLSLSFPSFCILTSLLLSPPPTPLLPNPLLSPVLRLLPSTNSTPPHNSGTGVGLVNDAIPAGDIVRNTREEARRQLRAIRFAFDEDGAEEKGDRSLLRQIGQTLYKHK